MGQRAVPAQECCLRRWLRATRVSRPARDVLVVWGCQERLAPYTVNAALIYTRVVWRIVAYRLSCCQVLLATSCYMDGGTCASSSIPGEET